MRLDLQPLTPWWSGDFNRDSSRPRETGFLGSMRWWYEGLIRGFNGWCCDPSSHRGQGAACQYEPPESSRSSPSAHAAKILCPACFLFGCTGWRRRFRLEISGLRPEPLCFFASNNVYEASGNWLWRAFGGKDTGGNKEGHGADARFKFGVNALWAEKATLEFEPHEDDSTVADQLYFLIHMMARYGSIGAKPQFGFGQFAIAQPDPEAQKRGRAAVEHAATAGRNEAPLDGAFLPDGRMLRYKFAIPKAAAEQIYRAQGKFVGEARPAYLSTVIPCAFDIRYKMRGLNPRTGEGQDYGLRPMIRETFGSDVASRIFGSSDGNDRVAGRIGISHLYLHQSAYILKLWGSLPEGLPTGVGDAIKQFILGIPQFKGIKEIPV